MSHDTNTKMDDCVDAISKLLISRDNLYKAIAPLQSKISDIDSEISTLIDEHNRQFLSTNPNISDVLKIISTRGIGYNCGALRKYLQSKLNQFGGELWGSWSDTNEISISFAVYEDGTNMAAVIDGINILTPLLSAHEDGMIWYGLRENTLSAYGVYRLNVAPNLNKLTLGITVYSRYKVIREFKSVVEAVDYIKNNHWYETSI